MKTSNDLLLEAKNNLPNHGLKSTWFELSIAIHASESRLNTYRKRKAVIPDELGLKLVKYLPYSEEQILFWLAAERGAKCPETAAIFEWVERQLPERWPSQIAVNG